MGKKKRISWGTYPLRRCITKTKNENCQVCQELICEDQKYWDGGWLLRAHEWCGRAVVDGRILAARAAEMAEVRPTHGDVQ